MHGFRNRDGILFQVLNYKSALPGVSLGRPCVLLIPTKTVNGRVHGSRVQLLDLLRAWCVIQGTVVAAVSLGRLCEPVLR